MYTLHLPFFSLSQGQRQLLKLGCSFGVFEFGEVRKVCLLLHEDNTTGCYFAILLTLAALLPVARGNQFLQYPLH